MDRRAEPTRVVVATFLLGAAGASLLSYVPFFVPGISKLTDWPILQIYIHTTFDIAAPEEALKLSVLILFRPVTLPLTIRWKGRSTAPPRGLALRLMRIFFTWQQSRLLGDARHSARSSHRSGTRRTWNYHWHLRRPGKVRKCFRSSPRLRLSAQILCHGMGNRRSVARVFRFSLDAATAARIIPK